MSDYVSYSACSCDCYCSSCFSRIFSYWMVSIFLLCLSTFSSWFLRVFSRTISVSISVLSSLMNYFLSFFISFISCLNSSCAVFSSMAPTWFWSSMVIRGTAVLSFNFFFVFSLMVVGTAAEDSLFTWTYSSFESY